MRLGLIVLLCLLNTGCALWRRDREEPVENGPRQEKAEPVLKPSEAMRPESDDIASPLTDRFYVRGTYFQGDVVTLLRVDSTGSTVPNGTLLNGEIDLGLDEQVNQGRMEFGVRTAERSNVRIDYFKLDRYGEVRLARDIDFGDFGFDTGDRFRTKLDWRMFSLSYLYSLLKNDRFEVGIGLGVHIVEAHAQGGEPGTLNREEDSEATIFPTAATTLTWRITKRFALTARYQGLRLPGGESVSGQYKDMHADVQFRWRKNLAFGVGYSSMIVDLDIRDEDEPFLFNLDTTGPEIFVRASF